MWREHSVISSLIQQILTQGPTSGRHSSLSWRQSALLIPQNLYLCVRGVGDRKQIEAQVNQWSVKPDPPTWTETSQGVRKKAGGGGVGQGKRCGQRAQGFPGQGDWEFLMQDRALGCFRTNNEKPVEGFVADLATFWQEPILVAFRSDQRRKIQEPEP